MIDPVYTPDEGGVWVRAGGASVGYSDGAAEARLLDILRRTNDLSVLSAELHQHINDWPTEYHLSPRRANLLRPLAVSPGDSVLELGCGCGAITRALGETGASVIAIEGALPRAAVAAARCRDLAKVRIVHDTIADVRLRERVDVVTLIGVLEYAPVYFGGSNPIGACLAAALRHLKPDGRLVVAIENQLGLKYFAGCAEDHHDKPYYGIQDLYGAGQATTFGRVELAVHLRAAGLQELEFLYPFPDYKLPEMIVHQRALDSSAISVADLLLRQASRDYAGRRLRAFVEPLAWQALGRNGLVGDLANSFLVVGRRWASEAPAAETMDWLAKAYAMSRRPEYMTETTIAAGPSGPHVIKRPLRPTAAPPVPEGPVLQQLADASYDKGTLHVADLYRILAQGLDLERISAWAAPWLASLERDLLDPAADRAVARLPGRCLDCTPFNLVRTATGFNFIDAEWHWHEPVPLQWVFIRGLSRSAEHHVGRYGEPAMTGRELVVRVAQQLGLPLDEAHMAAAIRLEDQFQESVSGSAPSFARYIDRPLGAHFDALALAQRATTWQQELAGAAGEVLRIKATLSWRITKPLRGIATLIRRLQNLHSVRTAVDPP